MAGEALVPDSVQIPKYSLVLSRLRALLNSPGQLRRSLSELIHVLPETLRRLPHELKSAWFTALCRASFPEPVGQLLCAVSEG